MEAAGGQSPRVKSQGEVLASASPVGSFSGGILVATAMTGSFGSCFSSQHPSTCLWKCDPLPVPPTPLPSQVSQGRFLCFVTLPLTRSVGSSRCVPGDSEHREIERVKLSSSKSSLPALSVPAAWCLL
jgi:hypothetical protein